MSLRQCPCMELENPHVASICFFLTDFEDLTLRLHESVASYVRHCRRVSRTKGIRYKHFACVVSDSPSVRFPSTPPNPCNCRPTTPASASLGMHPANSSGTSHASFVLPGAARQIYTVVSKLPAANRRRVPFYPVAEEQIQFLA